MFSHVPAGLPAKAPLLVVLHGCTQTAASFDSGSGWSTLADRYGFALLLPQQRASNNPKACFSWFQPQDTRRGQGEAASIRQMIAYLVDRHGLDSSRIFVTGLSAGGAMAASLLAAYPELFAGGAIVAGLPHGTASSVNEAFESMFQGRTRSAREWGDLVRAASSHRGPWPRVSVWHGSADTTVKASNADELVKQWTDVHGLPIRPDRTDRILGHQRDVWLGPDGSEVIESITIEGMAHGLPLAIAGEAEPHGKAGPFMLDVGIASSLHIAGFFGLRGPVRPADERAAPRPPAAPGPGEPVSPPSEPVAGTGARDIASVINEALRSAGLMR
jgi:feruloyl esterase